MNSQVGFFDKFAANANKNNLENFLNNYPDIKKELINAISQNNEYCVLGYTEVELQEDENGNLVRVEKSDCNEKKSLSIAANAASTSADGDEESKYYFAFVTSIYRNRSKNPYEYVATSTGTWSKNNATSGKKYPAGKDDYIMQTAPTSLQRTGKSITVTYNDYTKGKSGTHYSLENGDSSYLRYSIVDDPLGSKQLKRVRLVVTYEGNSSSKYRYINSYYVHTWQKIDLDISIDTSASLDKSLSVSLNFDPNIETDYWRVYSYVNFKF